MKRNNPIALCGFGLIAGFAVLLVCSTAALAAETANDWRSTFDLVMRWLNFLIIVFAGLAYLSFNYLIAGLFLLMRSKAHIRSLINHLKRILVYEAIPIAFAPLLTLILIELGAIPFIMIALSLILFSNLLKD